MPFNRYCHVRCFHITFGALLWSSCANEAPGRELALRVSPLELECATASPDIVIDVTAIPSSIEPFDPSRPQTYGSRECSGFIFEFDNPDREALRGMLETHIARGTADEAAEVRQIDLEDVGQALLDELADIADGVRPFAGRDAGTVVVKTG